MTSRWDALLDQKPVPLREHLLAECSKLFARELLGWPPRIDDATPTVASLLAAHPPRPGPELFKESFRLARWDLGRDLDAYDDYMRNLRYLEHGLAAGDKPMLLFLSRYIEEQLLTLSEATEGRVDRKGLLRVLDLTERAVLKPGEG